MDYSELINGLLDNKGEGAGAKPRANKQEEAFKIHKDIAENISKSQHLRAEINKDITAGADTTETLIKALECISLMTGDSIFYNVNKDKLEREQRTA